MGEIYLSRKEARRVYVLEQLVAGKLTAAEASRVLGLSTRQVKRLKAAFRQHGPQALAHKNRGRKPAHAVPEPTRQRILTLALDAYRHTSCQHMAELLAEHRGIRVSAKTVARILHDAGVPLRHTHKPGRRRRSRDRMPQRGLLVQIDASPYDWLEGRGPQMHLHGAIDDATGTILGLHFSLQEGTLAYFHVIAQVLRDHGVPRSIYSDRHTLFFSPKRDRLTVEQQLRGEKANLTQFGRALHDLGIEHIPARSPQAKGRIERLWGTLQSRLVVELRLAGITTLEQANAFLPAFIRRFNERFSVAPADSDSAFRPSPSPTALAPILALHAPRKASKGSTISYKNTLYRLVDSQGRSVGLSPGGPVTVVTTLKGDVLALHDGKLFKILPVPKPKRPAKTEEASPAPSKPTTPPRKPAADHPWRKSFRRSPEARPGHIERYVDRLIDDSYDDYWSRIYAQR